MPTKNVTINDILHGGGNSGATVTTAEATDPTQAAVNLVEQRRKEQAQRAQRASTAPSTGNVAQDFMNYQRAQNGQTPGNSLVFTPNVQTTTGANGDGGKDKDATGVNTEPQGSQRKTTMSYADMYKAMSPYKEPTKEELEKERKKEKRERLFAALGDGISALSNLFFTTRYAPNMYKPTETNSERVNNYWTKLKEEREANRRRYVEGYIKAKQADDTHAIQQQNADVAAAYKQADTERKNAIAKAQQESLAARANKDQAAADLADKKLEYLIAGWPAEQAEKQAKIDLLRAQTDLANRRGTSAWASSSGGGSGVSKSGGEYIAYDKEGNVHRFKQKGAAEQYAREQGTWQTDYSTSTSTKFGITTTSERPNGGHSVKPKGSGGGSRGSSGGSRGSSGSRGSGSGSRGSSSGSRGGSSGGSRSGSGGGKGGGKGNNWASGLKL